ncbi:hypothetical protein FACS1894139_04950 [Planctomycetales bacterium]|nr:hypothetical protein FACS1894139_04950 [Planctomycetales bacterium]
MKRHFTLIEMLIVVFIIALLAAIGFTVGSSVRKSAMRDAQAAENSMLLTACEKYYNDFGSYPLEYETTGFNSTTGPFDGRVAATAPRRVGESVVHRSLFLQKAVGASYRANGWGNQFFYDSDDGKKLTLAKCLAYPAVSSTAMPAFNIGDLNTYVGDYLNKGEARIAAADTSVNRPDNQPNSPVKQGAFIDVYGMPLGYWVHFKDGLKDGTTYYQCNTDSNWYNNGGFVGDPDGGGVGEARSNLAGDRLVPEIWSLGYDKQDGGTEGLRIKLWEAAEVRKESLPITANGAKATTKALDNIGGDYNHVRK